MKSVFAFILILLFTFCAEARATVLSDLVASMAPDTWATFTPSNAGSVMVPKMNINAYADSGVWDPVRKQFRFCGAYHSGPLECVIWDDATNLWSTYTAPPVGFTLTHAYDANAIDPVNGLQTWRYTNASGYPGNGQIWRFNIATSTWTQLSQPFSPLRCCATMVYFPGYIGAGGFLILQNTYGPMYFLPDGSSTWQSVPNSTNLHQADASYHFGEYNPVHNFLVFGSGLRKLWKLTSTGTITAYADIPSNINVYDGGPGNFTVDPVTGNYLFLTATQREFWKFNPISGAWTLGANQPTITSGSNFSQTPVSTYGVTLWMNCGTTSGSCNGSFLVYKGATSTPDTTAPTAPSSPLATVISSSQINVSWTASTDAVGVTGYNVERCTGAACSNFLEISTPAASPLNNTSLTASTLYRYRIRAHDAAGNLSSYSSIVEGTTSAGGGADADFAARCAAAGVLRCVGFDNTTTDIVQNVNLGAAVSGQFHGTLDTATKTSGAGSLRFRLPAGTTGANIAGSWSPPTADPAMVQRFGRQSTFYVSHRVRFSPEMFSNLTSWDSNWKVSIFHSDTATCAGIEITHNYRNYLLPPDNIPNFYSNCGSRGFGTNPTTNAYNPSGNPPVTQQQGDYFGLCNYNVWTNCWHYTSNEWIEFYYKIHIGEWSQGNSTAEVWVSRPSQDSGARKKIINVQDMILDCNNDCSGTSTEGYNNITFTPYMTGLSTSAPVDAYIWYDELIVSTQPIAVPGAQSGVSAPNAPSNLTVK